MLYLSLALTPIFIIILFIYFQDKYEREPIKTLLAVFLLGILSVIPAISIEIAYEKFFQFTRGYNTVVTILYAFIGVGLTEEFCKFIFLRWFIYRHKKFTEPMDGVVYSVMVSMGFAALENVWYVFSSHDPMYTAIARSLTAVPAHASFAVIMGLYFGYARFSVQHKRFYLLFMSVLTASLAHGLYDVFLFLNCSYCAIFSLLFLLLFIILSLRIISRFKKISPFRKRYTLLRLKKRVLSPEERLHIEKRKNELREKLKFKKNKYS